MDVLVVFRRADFTRFRGEISVADDAVLLIEADDTTPGGLDHVGHEGARCVQVPFRELARDTAGTPPRRTSWLGDSPGLFGFPEEGLRRAVGHKFGRKKEAVREANTKAFEAGVTFARSLTKDFDEKRLEYVPGEPLLLMSGNEASAVGAMHAGCRFFAGYPITPSSEILHFLNGVAPPRGRLRHPDRGRARRDRSRDRRFLRGREVDDGDVGAGSFAHDRDAGALRDGGGPDGDRGRAARGALDRAIRPRASSRTSSSASTGRTATRPASSSRAATSRIASTPRSTRSTSRRNSSSRLSSCPIRPSVNASRPSRLRGSCTRCAIESGRRKRSSSITSGTARRRRESRR